MVGGRIWNCMHLFEVGWIAIWWTGNPASRKRSLLEDIWTLHMLFVWNQLQTKHCHQLIFSTKRTFSTERTFKETKPLRCQRQLKELWGICLLREYHGIWNYDELLTFNWKHLSKQDLILFLKVYNIEGRTKLSREPRSLIQWKLDKSKIAMLWNYFQLSAYSLLFKLASVVGPGNFFFFRETEAWKYHYPMTLI